MSLLHPLRDLRRSSLLAEPPLPGFIRAIEGGVAHFGLLNNSEKARLINDARIFISEKEWEGGGGAPPPSDDAKAIIAAQACLLLLGWNDARRTDLFPNVRSIIVYPTGFHAEHPHSEGLVQVAEPVGLLGESWSSDLPVVLSLQSALDGAERAEDGHNVILHEFAHKLDTLSGGADGVPPLADDAAVEEWATVMSEEFRLLTHDAEHGHKTLLDTYGATNEAEFFAVATEAFFERAVRMRAEKPALYAALSHFYAQDTAARFEQNPPA